jgi:hypothetical protein
MTPERRGYARSVECRCSDLTELVGDEALTYREHLERVREERGAWLLRCPITGHEWVEDFPRSPSTREWVGTARLRRFPLHASDD